MTRNLSPLALFLIAGLLPTALYSQQDPLVFKGFSLGMSRDEVKEVYNSFVSQEVAKNISLEAENYRDLIMLDNEFSSMGNKVELAYDENMNVTDITFQYKTVDILFESSAEEAEAFATRLCKTYDLPEMEMDDQGFVTLWTVVLEAEGFKVSVDDMKNLRIQKLRS